MNTRGTGMNQPLADLVESSTKKVPIEDIVNYQGILTSIEARILYEWQENPDLNDKEVLSAYNKIKKDFEGHKKGSLAYELSQAMKGQLMLYKIEDDRIYTHGEIISCVRALIKIAKIHKSPSGIGYLHWIKTLYEGNLPKTEKDMLEYIQKYER